MKKFILFMVCCMTQNGWGGKYLNGCLAGDKRLCFKELASVEGSPADFLASYQAMCSTTSLGLACTKLTITGDIKVYSKNQMQLHPKGHFYYVGSPVSMYLVE